MIYLDSSVVLAHLFEEPRAPGTAFWQAPLTASKLLEYEVWNRIHFYRRTGSHGQRTRELLAGVDLIDLADAVLDRALSPFPVPIRTLDALHLATADYLRAGGEHIELASYDSQLIAAAQALGFAIAPL